MGRLYYDAISGTPDDGLIVALTFMFTLVYVIARMVLEVLYVFLDPRVRYCLVNRRGILRQLLASGPGRVGLFAGRTPVPGLGLRPADVSP